MRMKPALTSADVHKIMEACRAEASKNKWNVTIAIVDDGGALLQLARMDGASPTTAEVATGKARSAAATRRPTKMMEDRIKERVALLAMPNIPVQGGVPILHQNECVGAIGVSGVQSHEDEQVANAGVAAIS